MINTMNHGTLGNMLSFTLTSQMWSVVLNSICVCWTCTTNPTIPFWFCYLIYSHLHFTVQFTVCKYIVAKTSLLYSAQDKWKIEKMM
jgi:hypothetical protein